ncbi:MAG: hypothetical protein U1C56_02560 [Candidatus Curtissbacteria bacterium]|nr:hypothetical protein [Candidatus Curtissbacteria bacterium]
MKKYLIGLLLRLLDSGLKLKIDYKKIDRKALEDWAFHSFDDLGWKSYFGYEDLKILKELSYGREGISYWMLIGRRLQLLYLFDEMRKSFENKKSAEEKKQVEAEKENQKE